MTFLRLVLTLFQIAYSKQPIKGCKRGYAGNHKGCPYEFGGGAETREDHEKPEIGGQSLTPPYIVLATDILTEIDNASFENEEGRKCKRQAN